MIEVSELSKEYTVYEKRPGLKGSFQAIFHRKKITRQALKPLTFKLQQGQIIGLIGSNGAGKTTLIKMLSGIIHPSSGSAKVLGYTPWERDNRFRSQISVVMGQKQQLWWDLPAQDGLQLLKEIYQIPNQDFKSRLDDLSTRLNVKHLLHIQVRRLSLGERMKMEIIAALLHRPKVIFLDEPTIGLDFNAQKAIRSFLLEYHQQFNPIIILTSHYIEDIEILCKDIMILREGVCVYSGLLEDLHNTTTSYRVLNISDFNLADLHDGCLDELHTFGDLEQVGKGLRLTVEENRLSEAGQFVFQRLKAKELTIERPPLSDIIGQLIDHRGEL